MTIKVRLQTNYGREDFYPENDLAKAILEIMGRKVLTRKHLDILVKHKIQLEVEDDRNL